MTPSSTNWAWPWWGVIVAINAVNLVIGVTLYRRSLRTPGDSPSLYRKRMRVMGIIFVIVAAYRSVFVSRYLTQMAWFDTIANSSLLIRLLAWAAELSFAGLIAAAMLQVNRDWPAAGDSNSSSLGNFITRKSPYFLWTCIFLAQFFATGGVIAKSRLLFAIEETLWTLGFLSVLPLAVIQFLRVFRVKDEKIVERLRMLRGSTIIVALWCLIYCGYGLFFHLPFESWVGAIHQIKTGIPVLQTGTDAIYKAFTVVNVSKQYADWGFGFLFWHSAYFTVCVWISLFLMQAPRILPNNRDVPKADEAR